jgi:hypothetical protein
MSNPATSYYDFAPVAKVRNPLVSAIRVGAHDVQFGPRAGLWAWCDFWPILLKKSSLSHLMNVVCVNPRRPVRLGLAPAWPASWGFAPWRPGGAHLGRRLDLAGAGDPSSDPLEMPRQRLHLLALAQRRGASVSLCDVARQVPGPFVD